MGDQSGLIDMTVSDGAQRRVVIVMFADIVDSTRILSSLDPEDAHELLTEATERMTAAIHAFGGIVARVQGDGVLALFGSRATSEDDGLRACLAALSMADAFRNAPAPAILQQPLQVRVGIHAGQVLIHQTRNDMGVNGDVAGFSVHLAAKIEALCPPNNVAISADALSLVLGDITTDPIGKIDAGKTNKPVEVLRLVSVSPEYSLRKQFSRRFLSPMVGRATEFSVVYKAMEALAPHGDSLSIIAEAGMGKSRLCLEIQRLAQAMDMHIAEIRGVSFLQSTSYGALKSFMAGVMDIHANDSADVKVEKIKAVGLKPDHTLALLDMMDVPTGDAAFDALQGRDRADLASAAFTAFVDALPGNVPLVMIIEDVHALDAYSQETIEHMALTERTRPLLLIMTGRPAMTEYAERFSRLIINLEPLSEREARALVTTMRGRIDVPSTLEAEAVDRAAGNPFVLVEYLRSLADAGEHNADTLPVSIEALVQARMEQLSPAARQLLKILSIAGGELGREVAASLSGDEPLDDALDDLAGSGFVHDAAAEPIQLRHDLLRVACKSTLMKAERSGLHAGLLDALERLSGATLPLSQVAYHAHQSGALEKALGYYTKACKVEMRRSAVSAVTDLYVQAIGVCDKIGPGADRQRARLLLTVFDAVHQQGEFALLNQELKRADIYADVQRDPNMKSQALALMSLMSWLRSDHGVSKAQAETALTVATDENRLPIMMLAKSNLGNALHGLGNIDAAIENHRGVIAALEGDKETFKLGGLGLPAVVSRAFVIWYSCQRGDIDDAQAMIPHGLDIAAQESQPYSLVMMYAAAGLAALAQGATTRALEAFQAGFAICIDERIDAMTIMVASGLALSLVRAGAHSSALDALEDAGEAQNYKRGGQYTWVRWRIAKAEVMQAIGDTDDAQAQIDMAVNVAVSNGEPISEAIARLARGDFRLRSGADFDLAKKDYLAAIELATRHGLAPTTAFANAGLALVYTVEENALAHIYQHKAVSELSDMGLHVISQRFTDEISHVGAGKPCQWYNFSA